MEKHQQYLDDLCCVCGKKVGRVRYSVMKYQEVLSSMGLFVAHDIEDIHRPKQFCNSCYLTDRKANDRQKYQLLILESYTTNLEGTY